MPLTVFNHEIHTELSRMISNHKYMNCLAIRCLEIFNVYHLDICHAEFYNPCFMCCKLCLPLFKINRVDDFFPHVDQRSQQAIRFDKYSRSQAGRERKNLSDCAG